MILPRQVLTIGLTLILGACSSTEQDTAPDTTPLSVPTSGEAAGPRLSSGNDGTLVLSWMEADDAGTTLWYSTLAEDGWQFRRAVVSGKDMFVNWADLPSVVPLNGEHWVAHWLEMAGSLTYSYHVVITQSFDGGKTWADPIKPHTDDTPTEHGFVSLYPTNGKIGAVWLDGRKTGNEPSGDPTTSGMTLRGAVIDSEGALHDQHLIDDLICDCCQTDVAVAQSGPVVLYRDRTIDEIRDIFVSRNVGHEWTSGTALNDDGWQIAGCPVNGPAIAARDDSVAAAWFSVPGQKPAVQVRFSSDGGAGFDESIRLASAGTLGHVDIVMLQDGSAVVSWLQANPGGLADLVIRRVSADRQIGAVRTIASDVPARSVPQMALAGSDLVFVWTEATDGDTRIASARMGAAALLP
jgi:hypothetical protein